jgi:hypothetical protein
MLSGCLDFGGLHPRDSAGPEQALAERLGGLPVRHARLASKVFPSASPTDLTYSKWSIGQVLWIWYVAQKCLWRSRMTSTEASAWPRRVVKQTTTVAS